MLIKLASLIYLLHIWIAIADAAGCPFARTLKEKRKPKPDLLNCLKSPVECTQSPYRSYDGSCNNLKYPNLGTAGTIYARMLSHNYANGIDAPPLSKSGKPLPGARVISNLLYPDKELDDPFYNIQAMQYGQFMVHDMSLVNAAIPGAPDATCSSAPESFPIPVPKDDPSYEGSTITCMNFLRTANSKSCTKSDKPVDQLSQVNQYLDLSIVYGDSVEENKELRLFNCGKLRSYTRNNQEWLPENPNAATICHTLSPDEPCYLAGDVRANQSPQLTMQHTIFLREHNRIADTLCKLNPDWNDEKIFQEARKINIAQHQQISYYEWLPIFIGRNNGIKNKIIYDTNDFVNDYQQEIDPSTINEYANAASRYFHNLVVGHLHLLDKEQDVSSTIRMSDWFDRPGVFLEDADNFVRLTRGLVSQPEHKASRYHDSEMTQFLFRRNETFGQDLKAIDLQRNRDHGLASYNSVRKHCGLGKVKTFEEFSDVISVDDIKLLETLYEDPNDVDLSVGGSMEKWVNETMMGPTFLCIFNEHHYRKRVGDRFWFENESNGFTLNQLNEIRKATIAKVFCDNVDMQSNIQPSAFARTHSTNTPVPCNTLASVNLLLWKENTAS